MSSYGDGAPNPWSRQGSTGEGLGPTDAAPSEPAQDEPAPTPTWQSHPYNQPAHPFDPGAPVPAYEQGMPGQPAMPPTYGYQSYSYAAPAYQPYAAMPYPAMPAQHPQAVAALILGILGLPFICFLAAIPAIIIGTKVRRDCDREPGRWSGRGFGMAGLIMGIVSAALTTGYIVLMIITAAVDSPIR